MKDEAYWNSKHPFVNQLYNGRPLPNGRAFEMDVRDFIFERDIQLQEAIDKYQLRKENNDDTAWEVQKYAVSILKYLSDSRFGVSEYWLFPSESLSMRSGDCEDGAILMASLLINALPPEQAWRVRVAAGYVETGPNAPLGGHAYVTYCRCSDNEWVALDWCYYEDSSVKVANKPLIKDVPHYRDVWFSFNHLHAWSHMSFTMRGRVKLHAKRSQ